MANIFEDAVGYTNILHREDANVPTYSHEYLIQMRKKYPDPLDWEWFERAVHKLLKPKKEN